MGGARSRPRATPPEGPADLSLDPLDPAVISDDADDVDALHSRDMP